MKKLILTTSEAVKADENTLGGKARNLALLSRSGFSVPSWFVLTTDAFSRQIDHLGIRDLISDRIGKLADSDADVAKLAEEIQEAIASGPLADDIQQSIREAFDGAVPSDAYYAVRSSVTGEDAAGASFAGQMDSCLYQQGEQAIFASVINVMKSAYNHRALVYRLQKGLSIADIKAAIIIQEMIDADVSGVMFTAHPITGSRQHALISSAWGCGEGIVSGICNTDEITVSLFSDETDVVVNDKDTALVLDAGSSHGTRETAIEESRRNIPSLTQDQILELRNTALSIAENYKTPQDIEWCLKDGSFYILQARPVTSLPPLNAEGDDIVVWDNSNIQESYCGVTTPLTFSFANRAYKTVYEQTMRLLGVKEDEILAHQGMLENMLGLINGRVYYNINNWYRGLLFLPSFSTNKADMERMMGLTDPVDMIHDQNLTFREKLRKLPQFFRALTQMLTRFRKMNGLVEEFRSMFRDVYQSVNRECLHTLSVGQLITLSRRLDKQLLENWTTPIVNDFYVMMMNGKVSRWLESASIENPDVVQNNLLSGEEGIESTEPTKFLLRLCDELRKKPDLKQLVEETDNGSLLDVLQVTDNGFWKQCKEYIELYGDRTMGELKLESGTLRQDASFMFAVLKNFLSREDLTLATLSENEARFRGEAEELVFPAIQKQQSRRALKKFRRDLNRLRDAIRNRENMRLARTRMFGLYRDIYLEIGNQLAFYGELDERRDVFWLTLEELYAYNDGRSVQKKLRPLVKARKEEFAEYESEDLPHHFHTRGAVYLNNQYEYPGKTGEESDPNASQLKGTGCYPGIVEDRIRLIFSPEDELSLDGQILCTVRTDPGWAPLFPSAGGILVERGSTLSHSAVVARELGIPAIVGIPDITRIVSDREMVRMNGSTGIVDRLENEEQDESRSAVNG